ncbi:MAG: cofactor-independent phosphoglycerate mutase [Smithellaceae bacterium]|nr:cofactor-independent phosphoglycerate mutase [Syntrophaceae bacterium]MDD4240087.1 cofactor-independent phosphoglycerate mutase [Smithellaceae bacterium]NLX51451.1 cofactor-independent phosphoglycerate mutase [Deltaproteobacteria bacterium]
MKYVVLLGDGMADYPSAQLGGKTPLECALTPFLDQIAAQGTLGLVNTIPEGLTPGSDVANLSVLGYNPEETYTGRGPLEAASMGIGLGADDVAYRCNLVSIGEQDSDQAFMDDFTAGHISSAEAGEMILEINAKIGSSQLQFYPGVGYRHLLVWRNAAGSPQTTPPHDIPGKAIAAYLPAGDYAAEVHDLMQKAARVLKDHPVNAQRLAAGKKQANSIWLWGQGRKPQIVPLTQKYDFRGGMISAVDLLKGLGVNAGLQPLTVEGATGYIDTNYEGKAKMALDALKFMDFVFLHLEAPDEMGHEGNAAGKIQAIEFFDEKIVGPILTNIGSLGEYRILALSDHPTPIDLKTHVGDPSPFAVLSSRNEENKASGSPFTEACARKTGIVVSPGHLLMDNFIKNWGAFLAQ